jgi:hypothetical protein
LLNGSRIALLDRRTLCFQVRQMIGDERHLASGEKKVYSNGPTSRDFFSVQVLTRFTQ